MVGWKNWLNVLILGYWWTYVLRKPWVDKNEDLLGKSWDFLCFCYLDRGNYMVTIGMYPWSIRILPIWPPKQC